MKTRIVSTGTEVGAKQLSPNRILVTYEVYVEDQEDTKELLKLLQGLHSEEWFKENIYKAQRDTAIALLRKSMDIVSRFVPDIRESEEWDLHMLRDPRDVARYKALKEWYTRYSALMGEADLFDD